MLLFKGCVILYIKNFSNKRFLIIIIKDIWKRGLYMRGNLILLFVAMIWGAAFVAQKTGMDYVGAFTFNGVRFALGAISLIPLIYFFAEDKSVEEKKIENIKVTKIGFFAGFVMFCAISLQQIGLIYTTAGKTAFITCLYIVLVPLIGVFFRNKLKINTILGVALAVLGLYFLCVKENLSIAYGDLLVLVCSLFWAIHILLIDKFAKKIDSVKLACCQFLFCSLFSMIVAILFENVSISSILSGAVPILYGGLASVGIAYTLQIVGQKYTSPANAAMIMSTETIFGVLAGFLFLNETLGNREIVGCVLMMVAIIIAQFDLEKFINKIKGL